jgi:hypothetical protein
VKRTLARLAIVLGVLIASTGVVATAAYALPDGYTTMLRSWAQGQCLDTNGVDVYNHACVFNVNQRWRFEMYSEGSVLVGYRVVNFAGRCLDSNDNGNVYTSPCQDPNHWQKWKVHDFYGSNAHHIFNLKDVNTGRCLDANQAWLHPYTNGYCYTPGYQDWKPGF